MFHAVRILACATSLALAGGTLHAQEWRFDADARVTGGVPTLVTVTVTPLVETTGRAAGGPGTTASQYRYGDRGQLLEWVYFQGGRPVEYTRCEYDDSLRLLSRLTRTAVSEITSTFSYAPGFSIEVVQPGSAAPTSWTQREMLRGLDARKVYWVRTFDPDGTLTGASRTERDARGRAVETIFYAQDGTVDAVHRYQYSGAATREVLYDARTNRAVISALTRDARGQVVERDYRPADDPQGRSIQRTDYRYDAFGNWIERTLYAASSSAGTRAAPLLRACREISFRSEGGAAGAASIEPRRLFPRVRTEPAGLAGADAADPATSTVE